MVELVVFDMAGTTVDENNVVYKTVRESVNANGYAFTQDQVQEVGAGKEKSRAIQDVLCLDGNPHDEVEVQTIFADFQTRLSTAYRDLDIRECPGAGEVFAALRSRNVKVALNTGYNREVAVDLVSRLGWQVGVSIDALVTDTDVECGRPHPDMIWRAMETTGVVDASRVAKIGDSQIDILEGKNAGCGWTFGITTGAQTESQLREANPTAIFHQLSDLLTYSWD